MKAKKRLVSLVLVMLLLLSLSMGVFAGADGGPVRPPDTPNCIGGGIVLP